MSYRRHWLVFLLEISFLVKIWHLDNSVRYMFGIRLIATKEDFTLVRNVVSAGFGTESGSTEHTKGFNMIVKGAEKLFPRLDALDPPGNGKDP